MQLAYEKSLYDESLLLEHVLNFQRRFPKFLEKESFLASFKRLCANAPKAFTEQRDRLHLLHILIVQNMLQQRIEKIFAVEKRIVAKRKTFRKDSSVCLLAIEPYFPREPIVDKDLLMKKILALMPGMQEISGSFWRWLHPELPYVCFYVEIERLRGQKFTTQDFFQLKSLCERQDFYSNSQDLFLPFNEEEAFKQIVFLQKELRPSAIYPELMVHFRRQLQQNLEFLVTLVRPFRPENKDQSIVFSCFAYPIEMHINRKLEGTFPQEAWCFSCFVPLDPFQDGYTIDVISAREHVMHALRSSLGTFRDYNGGLIITQNLQLKKLWERIVGKIPESAVFINKLLYTLQPVEARLTLPCEDIEKLVRGVAALMSQSLKEFHVLKKDSILIVRNRNLSELKQYADRARKEKCIYSLFEHYPFFYFCSFNPQNNQNASQVKEIVDLSEILLKHQQYHTPAKPILIPNQKREKELKLALLDGALPSLNPYLSGGDIRCRLICKLLFEGLVRLDPHGQLQPAAAEKIDISNNGLGYTFHLRSFSWSNGYPVTAYDFANAWKNILSKKWLSNKPEMLFVIKNGKKCFEGKCAVKSLGIQVIDIKTLQVELEYPDAYFLEKLIQPMFFPLLGTSQEPRYFNGPFLIKQNNHEVIELEANPYYWDHSNLFFQRIKFFCNLDLEAILTLFEQGEIDWMGDPLVLLPKRVLQKLKAQSRLSCKKAFRPLFLYLNTEHPALSCFKIRKALSISLNRSYISRDVLFKRIPLYHPLPITPHAKLRENPQKAFQLFEDGMQALLKTHSYLPPLTLTLPRLPDQFLLGEYLKDTWEKTLGLSINVEYLPWNLFRGNLEKKEFHMWGAFDTLPSRDKIAFLQRFENKDLITNFPSWEHTEYKQSFASIFHEASTSQREKMINRSIIILNHHTPYIPICLGPLLFSKSSKLRGEVIDFSGCLDFRFAFFQE
jgi:oligopeptide transport system substrate-binding protein